MKVLKLLFMAIILLFLNTQSFADLRTDRAVIKNDGSENIFAIASFSEPVEGDLYVATQVDGEIVFLINEGSEFSAEPAPFRADSQFEDDIVVLDQPVDGMVPGHYPLFKIITQPDTNPLDFRNWVDGINGLSRINFSIGLSVEESEDHDSDGFPDGDLNRDGYRDVLNISRPDPKKSYPYTLPGNHIPVPTGDADK